jgi:hypothetical protein
MAAVEYLHLGLNLILIISELKVSENADHSGHAV